MGHGTRVGQGEAEIVTKKDLIVRLQAPRFFVDNQLRGPYRLWHHEHHFREVDGGVEMADILHYELPFGVLGEVAHRLFVRRKIESIFAHRREVLERKIGRAHV